MEISNPRNQLATELDSLSDSSAALPRRRILEGAVAAGAAVPILAACGGDPETTTGETSGEPAAEEQEAPEQKPDAGDPAADHKPVEGSRGSARVLAKTGDIPVGGGVVVKEQKIVVTQPDANEFKAFSAVCTHQGCLVGSVESGTIVCPCHKSAFSAADGQVKRGPASAPLEEKPITVDGDSIMLA
ncbi:MAG TPA: Rieske (2Fe-2S) protein [Actinopolymorphaceae bacterium]